MKDGMKKFMKEEDLEHSAERSEDTESFDGATVTSGEELVEQFEQVTGQVSFV